VIENDPTKINILKDKETLDYEIIQSANKELPQGFTHILTFYYK
jgi:hypothetical protein